MPEFENNTFEVDEEVIIHTKDGRGHDQDEHSGKIVNVAIKLITIEWVYNGHVRRDKFRKEERCDNTNFGVWSTANNPWFERPWEKQTRLAVEKATETLENHGFEVILHHRPLNAKILAVAAFLEGHDG